MSIKVGNVGSNFGDWWVEKQLNRKNHYFDSSKFFVFAGGIITSEGQNQNATLSRLKIYSPTTTMITRTQLHLGRVIYIMDKKHYHLARDKQVLVVQITDSKSEEFSLDLVAESLDRLIWFASSRLKSVFHFHAGFVGDENEYLINCIQDHDANKVSNIIFWRNSHE